MSNCKGRYFAFQYFLGLTGSEEGRKFINSNDKYLKAILDLMQVQWIYFFLHFSGVNFVVMLFNCSPYLIFAIHWYNSVAGRTGSYCKGCVSCSCKLNRRIRNMQQSIILPNRARLPDIFTAVHPKTGQCVCGYRLPDTFKHVSV